MTVNGGKKGIVFFNLAVIIGVCIYLLSMALNYISYFMCIAFTWFIRKIASHASSRVAIAFFFGFDVICGSNCNRNRNR